MFSKGGSKLGQTSTDFKAKRRKSARNMGIIHEACGNMAASGGSFHSPGGNERIEHWARMSHSISRDFHTQSNEEVPLSVKSQLGWPPTITNCSD